MESEKEDLKKSFQALRSAARVNHLVVMILEFGMILWRGRQQPREREDCCAVHFKQQSLKSARAISSQYFTCKGERKKGRRNPMLLLRQGRRQTGPPSSEGEFQGSNAVLSLEVAHAGSRKACASNSRYLFIFCKQKPGKEKRKSMSRNSIHLLRENMFTDVLNKNIPWLFFLVYFT